MEIRETVDKRIKIKIFNHFHYTNSDNPEIRHRVHSHSIPRQNYRHNLNKKIKIKN